MKILFVSCLLPYPKVLHGGGTDLFHLIESLAQRHEVHLISLAAEEEAEQAHEMTPYCASVRTVVPAWSWRQKLRNALRGGWRHPLSLGRRAQGLVRAGIRRTCLDRGIDVVQFEWTETGGYVDAVPNGDAVRILDEVDVSFRPAAHRAANAPRWTTPLAQWRARQAETHELALCRRFDAVLTRSKHDRRVLLERLGSPAPPVHLLEPWTHVHPFVDVTGDNACPGRLLFLGAMDRDENYEAAAYLAKDIFPLVRARCPNTELSITGARPQARVLRLSGEAGVHVTGYVEDLRSAYAACDVFVAPMRTPGGIFNKIVDAMGAGRPVVTTSLGNEGLAAPVDSAVLVADDPSGLADRIVALLQDRALWRQVAASGRRHVQVKYRWADNVARLEALYDSLVDSKRRAGGGR